MDHWKINPPSNTSHDPWGNHTINRNIQGQGVYRPEDFTRSSLTNRVYMDNHTETVSFICAKDYTARSNRRVHCPEYVDMEYHDYDVSDMIEESNTLNKEIESTIDKLQEKDGKVNKFKMKILKGVMWS